MDKEMQRYAISHNDIGEIDRGTWRKYNPYNPYVEEDEEEKIENLNIESLDDLFEDEDKKESVPVIKNDTSVNKEDTETLDSLLNPNVDADAPLLPQDEDEDTYDLQKELEKKFDELFGSLDEDETNIKEENSQQENLSKDDNVIVLNDEDGNDIKFDFLDLIEYDGDEFVVLLPSDENADEVVILKVEDGETEDTESYVSVDDDLVLNNVFSIFKERFKEEFHFCESNE